MLGHWWSRILQKSPAWRTPMLIALALSIVSGGLGAWVLSLSGEIYQYQDTVDGVHFPPVDAIVCLAGGRGRITAAGDVWYRYWELNQRPVRGVGPSPEPAPMPILYMSGMGPQANWFVLAKQVRRGVLDVLRPQNAILETESTNTEENARYLARYAANRGWDRILLVTSSYHMKRARWIFEQTFKPFAHPVAVETLSVYQEPFEPDEWKDSFQGIRITVWEFVKWRFYRAFWHTDLNQIK